MEVIQYLSPDQLLVPLPSVYESPDYLPDCIAVAAEECSGSYSQGSSSPDTCFSATDDTNLPLLDGLPTLDEAVANELVNDLVYEDLSFGSILIDDIGIFLNEPDKPNDQYLLSEENVFECLSSSQLAPDTPTRRKQRIIPIASEPFESGVEPYAFNVVYPPHVEADTCSRKRLHATDLKYPATKLIRPMPASAALSVDDHMLATTGQWLPEDNVEKSLSRSIKDTYDSTSGAIDNGKVTFGVRQRKRGLTKDERKERKKQSNRNASYRYRQRKKEEADGFLQNSMTVLKTFEKEKEAYQNVVEEFIRCIQLASAARDKRKMV